MQIGYLKHRLIWLVIATILLVGGIEQKDAGSVMFLIGFSAIIFTLAVFRSDDLTALGKELKRFVWKK